MTGTRPLRIVANLDCEEEWAGRPGARGKARRQAAVLGTLLRVLARDDHDVLWTVAPLDAALVRDVPGLPRPILESGAPPRSRASLAWGAALAWGATRAFVAHDAAALERPVAVDFSRPLHETLRDFPPAHPAVAARVNRRDFCLTVARELGFALEGAAWIESLADLDRAAARIAGPFVLKGALSAAGRERLVIDRDALAAPASRARADALLVRNGALLVEPWLDRTDDFGALALVDDREVHVVGTHRQLVAESLGRFRGIAITRDAVADPGLAPGESALLASVLRHVGERLRAAGYRGPFGVDAWRWRDAANVPHFHPLGEINARLTMGFVARALVERIPRAALPGGCVTLRVGPAGESSGLVLVADPPDGAAAWLVAE